MSLTADQVFIEALSLPPRLRCDLAERLMVSLTSDEVQREIDDAWKIELDNRCKAFDEGKMTERNAEDVIQDIRAKLRRM